MDNRLHHPANAVPDTVRNERERAEDSEALLELGETSTPENFWSLNDVFQGTRIFGATGGGKSNGSGKAIALA